jgi:outer membrane protein assembly factor BamB
MLVAVYLGVCLRYAQAASPKHPSPESEQARQILDATCVRGGLVVHLGCGNGRLTTALRANGSYLVHGLDADVENIKIARDYIHSLRLYGKVSVQQWTAKYLPYTDNFVNLIVIQDPRFNIQSSEIERVLVPDGVAVTDKSISNGELLIANLQPSTINHQQSPMAERWSVFRKPWPDELDNWTHFLYDASNNAVSQDRRIGPLKHIQWKNKPMWCRHHNYNISIAAMVSENGRVFYIEDRGPVGVFDSGPEPGRKLMEDNLPQVWDLVARDAFNGQELWRRPMRQWGPAFWDIIGFRKNPLVLPRRLVASNDKLYVTFQWHGPVHILDAATGETLRVCRETNQAYEVIIEEGILLTRSRSMRNDEPEPRAWEEANVDVVALDADTGTGLWRSRVQGCMLPLSLCAGDGRVCYNNHKEIVCLDLKTGNQLWSAPCQAGSEPQSPSAGHKYLTGKMIIYDGTIVYNGPRRITAFSLSTGKKLWDGPTGKHLSIIPGQPPDLFGAQGLIWPTGIKNAVPQKHSSAVHVKGFDPRTGKVQREIRVPYLLTMGHHMRCYPSKATERYLLLPKRGIEFLDLERQNHTRTDWTRPPCSLGVMPANGLMYLPPHPCNCANNVMLHGFNAVCSDCLWETKQRRAEQLVQGPAFRKIIHRTSKIANASDWPTYRHDKLRSGSTKAKLPAEPEILWEREFDSVITQPVSVNGRLFVTRKDAHAVDCLTADTGEHIWSYTADGRIDSPPTLHNGLVLFGCTDGWIYCLRESDGELAWKFNAAPKDRLVGIYQQLESAWPVHGSVLVQDGIAYCSAGRSTYLDGGIYLYALAPETGKILHKNHIRTDEPPDVMNVPPEEYGNIWCFMEGTRSDIMVSDGSDVYMAMSQWSPQLEPRKLEPDPEDRRKRGSKKMGMHLSSTKGFLDDTWFNRTFWVYFDGWTTAGRQYLKEGQILCFDEEYTYGLEAFPGGDWRALFKAKVTNYHLFCHPNGRIRREGRKDVGMRWERETPLRARAMLLSGNHLYICGPANEFPPEDPLGAIEGRRGSLFRTVSPKTGEKLYECHLDAVPVFDGMMSADGHIYIATEGNRLLCMGKEE